MYLFDGTSAEIWGGPVTRGALEGLDWASLSMRSKKREMLRAMRVQKKTVCRNKAKKSS